MSRPPVVLELGSGDADGGMSAAGASAQVLERLSGLFTDADTPADVAAVAIDQVYRALGAQLGYVGLLEPDDADALVCIAAVALPAEIGERTARLPLTASFPVVEAVRSGEPVFVESATELAERFPDAGALLGRHDVQAVAAVPAFANGRVRGAIAVSFTTEHRFTPEERRFIVAAARQCAQALIRSRLYQNEQAARRRAEQLAHLASALSPALGDVEVARIAVREAQRVVGATAAACYRLDGHELHLLHADGYDAPLQERWRRFAVGRAGVPIGEAVREQRVVAVEPDGELAAAYAGEADVAAAIARGTLVAVPLLVDGRALGALCLTCDGPQPCPDDDRALLLAIGHLCGQALERARLFAEQRMAAERAERLQAVGAALASVLSPEAVSDVIVEAGREALGAWAGSVMLLDEATREFTIVRSIGFPPETLERFARFPADVPLPAGEVYRTHAAVFLPNYAAWETRYPDPPRLAPAGRRAEDGAWAVLPLSVDDRLLGVFALSFADARPFDAGERAFMLSLARQCAHALERARLYEEAISANRAKANFLATMSHELRTPLTAVLGYTELVQDGVVGPLNDTQRDHLLRARAAGEHLLILINDVLSFARLEAGKEAVHHEEFNLAAVVEETLAMLAPMASKKGIALEEEYLGAPPTLQTDRQKLRQILLNLLANAVKFTEQGTVAVRIVPDGAQVAVEVRDTGPGIAPEHHEALFDPFWQVDQGRTRTVGGTGLGLAVARELARLIGGDVTVRSAVGAGSTFVATVPLRAPRAA